MTHDVVIVGAGPGGSNAAAVLLDAGLTVAQVDKASFPRAKPCGGALTVKACRSLRLELEPSLRSRFASFEFNLWNEGRSTFTYRSEMLSMVLRSQFDEHLVAQNRRRRGFTFWDDEPVKAIEWKQGLFRVRTARRDMEARQLIGADGAYSIVNRTFGISRPCARATAVEVNLPRADVQGELPGHPCFDFGAIRGGYGWVFPRDDQLSVGLYTLAGGIKDYRARLARYVAARGIGVRGDPLGTFEAHLIPVGGHRLEVPEAPVYLVGDAGGFADALTGEGIYHALESGRLAGETAVRVARGRGTHRRYYRRLWRSVLCDTYLSYRCSGPFYRKLGTAMHTLWNPLVWRPLVHGYGNGATLTRCVVLGGYYLAASVIRNTARQARV